MRQFVSSMLHNALPDPYQQQRSRLQYAIGVLSQQEPSDVPHRLALAEAEFRLAILPTSDLQESIDHLQRAIAYDPLHPKLFFHLGRCLYQCGDFRGAAQEYRHALKFAPGSHRIYAHLALALLELDKEEKKVGQAILDILLRGAEHELAGQLTQLDELAKAQRTSSGAQEKDQSPNEEITPPSASSKKKEAGAAKPRGKAKQPVVESRWQGVWRLVLVSQLSAGRPNQKQVNKSLEKGEMFVQGKQGIAEYAVACLFQLLNGEDATMIRQTLASHLKDHMENPAVQLVQSAVALEQISSTSSFVENAVKELQAGRLPLEVICCLHLAKFGTSSTLSLIEALRVLDYYPLSVRQEHCFRELHLSLLDSYARKAYAEGRYDHARLLWRETIPLDPHRIAVAHNLALVATRTKSYEHYALTWERVAELGYLHAAAANDVRVCLEERQALHLAFAQQSKQRYCAATQSSRNHVPKEEEIRVWLADRTALDAWLREWDLYYLNTRLRFHSPIHLLGVSRDASEQTVKEARDAFVRHINFSLLKQTWAGIQTFCQLAEQIINQATEQAASNIERIRDPYYEEEKTEADALAQDAIDRGVILYRMICILAKKPPASYLSIGCAIARRFFALPWEILQPLCVMRGMLSADENLVELFENAFVALLSSPAKPTEISAQLAALDEASTMLPHPSFRLKLVRTKVLVEAKKNAEAYTSAIDLLPLLPTIKDESERAEMGKNIANLVDNLAFGELPERLRELNSLESVQETIRLGRPIVKKYPRAGGFRAVLASLMLKISSVNIELIEEAKQLLEQGLPLALNDEQRQEFEKLLAESNLQQAQAPVMQEIKTLLEGASASVEQALERTKYERTAQVIWNVRAVLDQAIRDAERARTLARDIKLPDVASQADNLQQQFQALRGQLDRIGQ